MNRVVDKALNLTSPSHRPNFFCRYVDDWIATFPNPISIDIFLTNVNNIRNQIQFTKELEIHNSLTFLDVFKEKTSSGIKTAHITNLPKLIYCTNQVHKLFSSSLQTRSSQQFLTPILLYLQFLYHNGFWVPINQRHPCKKRIPIEFHKQMHLTIFQQKVHLKTPQTNPNKTFNFSTL